MSDETRLKILETAKELGYEPNPEISNFMSQLRQGELASFRSTIGWLNVISPESSVYSYWDRVFEGAQKKGADLGYHIETFFVKTKGLSPKRLSQILISRGIRGVVLGVADRPFSKLNLEWGQFSAVAISYGVVRPDLPRIVSNHQQITVEALKRIQRKGYKRMGLFLVEGMEYRTGHGIESGFYLFQNLNPKKAQCFLKIATIPLCTPNEICDWIRELKLDVVVTPNTDVIEKIQEGGIDIPRDIAFATLEQEPRYEAVSGINQRPDLLGAAAIQKLHGLIDSRTNALTADPSITLINGKWVEGTTTPSRYF